MSRRLGYARVLRASAWLAVVTVFVPSMAWACLEPVRVLAPALAGASCPSERICLDDETRYGEASALYEAAFERVQATLGTFRTPPRVTFCSSETCFESFGLRKSAGHTFGTWGIVIGPRGWQPHYVRHEMIHHLQAERVGNVRFWRCPEWFGEGMAYALSEDPRASLTEPFQGYRLRFEAWQRARGTADLWARACER
jgi:hypothetical protein